MVESVTMSLAIGIIAVVVLAMAFTRALKRRARQSRTGDAGDPTYRRVHPNGWDAAESPDRTSESDRLRSRKAGGGPGTSR